MPAEQITAIAVPATTTNRLFALGPVQLMGWALVETTGAAVAAAELYDGNDATGQSLLPVTFQANESVRDWFGTQGILCQRGLYLNVTAGSVRGTLFVKLQQRDTVYDVLTPPADA